jgi:hypothetical protein
MGDMGTPDWTRSVCSAPAVVSSQESCTCQPYAGLPMYVLLDMQSRTFADRFIAVAFCWYNISSIVNSLVYFDQFSLLTTRSILLVCLGMVVLLGGVWVVSAPGSGDGGEGVDVGSWDDEGHGEIFLRHDHDASSAEAGHESRRVSMDIPDITEPGTSPRPPPLSLPASPRLPRQWPSLHTSTSASAAAQRKSTILSPPIGASGFAIGISAASPGFSLLPRRRIASGASGFSDTVTRAQAMRRTVSEGDDGTAAWEAVHPPLDDTERSGAEQVAGSRPSARKRWAWIRRLIRP